MAETLKKIIGSGIPKDEFISKIFEYTFQEMEHIPEEDLDNFFVEFKQELIKDFWRAGYDIQYLKEDLEYYQIIFDPHSLL